MVQIEQFLACRWTFKITRSLFKFSKILQNVGVRRVLALWALEWAEAQEYPKTDGHG